MHAYNKCISTLLTTHIYVILYTTASPEWVNLFPEAMLDSNYIYDESDGVYRCALCKYVSIIIDIQLRHTGWKSRAYVPYHTLRYTRTSITFFPYVHTISTVQLLHTLHKRTYIHYIFIHIYIHSFHSYKLLHTLHNTRTCLTYLFIHTLHSFHTCMAYMYASAWYELCSLFYFLFIVYAFSYEIADGFCNGCDREFPQLAALTEGVGLGEEDSEGYDEDVCTCECIYLM